MTTNTTPAATWSQANKLAKALPLEQVTYLLTEDGNPRIYEKHHPVRIAYDLFTATHSVFYRYCNRGGYEVSGRTWYKSYGKRDRDWVAAVFQLRDGRYIKVEVSA